MGFVIRRLNTKRRNQLVAASYEELKEISKFKTKKTDFVDSEGKKHIYKLHEPVETRKSKKYNYHVQDKYKGVEKSSPPFPTFKNVNGDKEVDVGKTAHMLHQRYGRGLFDYYYIGGRPPLERYFHYYIEKHREQKYR